MNRFNEVEVMSERRERAEQVEAYNRFLLQEREREQVILDELGRNWFDRFLRPVHD